jgi:hypothetical protein
MNFGKWIVVAFISFALFIGVLVTVCVRQDISLVSKNYYQEELDYQNQIERERNAQQLREKPSISIANHQLTIAFSYFEEVDRGELQLFRPSDVRFDKTFPLRPLEADKEVFDIRDLPPGMYKARMQWSMLGKEYYLEQILNL